MSKTMTFKEAADAWYHAADRYSSVGASDTEPRGEFAQIIIDLYQGKEPVIPTTVRGWQLFSGVTGNGLGAALLTRMARQAVEVGKGDHMGLVRYVKGQGWDW